MGKILPNPNKIFSKTNPKFSNMTNKPNLNQIYSPNYPKIKVISNIQTLYI